VVHQLQGCSVRISFKAPIQKAENRVYSGQMIQKVSNKGVIYMVRFKKHLLIFFTICLLAMAFSVVPAAAADDYDIYLKLDGISGESKTKNYQNWIQLDQVSFDIANNSTVGSASKGSGAGKAVQKDLTIEKQFDSSSIPLFLDLVTGKAITKGQIVFVKPGTTVPFVTIDLDTVGVIDYSFSGHEIIKLDYGAINFKYSVLGPDGKVVNTITGGWDFLKNQKK
jgi:type VI protein secretion system component Hcp